MGLFRNIGKMGAALAFVGLTALSAHAGDFPDRPITLLVPYPPGGVVDPIARVLSEKLQSIVGQPVVVENKPGAGGAIATQYITQLPADGYTVLLHTNSIAIHESLAKEPLYDLDADLRTIGVVAEAPYLVVTGSESPVESFADLLARIRAEPGNVDFGSAGIGASTHLAVEYLALEAGLSINHVPFTGGGPTHAALLRQDVLFTFDTITGSAKYVESGQFRPLAVTTAERSRFLPDVPTIAESGVPGFNASFWVGLFVDADTPSDVVATLQHAVEEAKADPVLKETFTNIKLDVAPTGASDFATQVAAEVNRWPAVVAKAGLQAQ